MYSQNDEEEVILKNIPDGGRFLDCGAFDGISLSNTYALVQRGWTGICVEPDPESFAKLQKTHETSNDVKLVHALAGFRWRLRDFYSNATAYATTEQTSYDKWKCEQTFQKIVVPEVPLKEIISGQKFDFISIDTEGTSFDLLQECDLDALGCSLVCVEYDDREIEVRSWFRSKCFKVIHKTGENLIAKRTAAEELGEFALAEEWASEIKV